MIKVKDWVALTGFARVPAIRLVSDYHRLEEVTAVDVLRREGKSEAFIHDVLKKTQDSMYTMVSQGVEIIPTLDPRYPDRLKKVKQSPATLYIKGDSSLLKVQDTLSIVGLRDATDLGKSVAYYTAALFMEKGYTIISGLALGVDGAAHQAAVDKGVPTIAVLGTAIDRIYPSQHLSLAQAILGTGGMILSEVPAGAPTSGQNFVRRNRTITGLSDGVCAVQATIDGGTMHTIRFAEEQERVLFVPKIQEDPTLPEYEGIHEAVAYHGAKVFDTDADVNQLVSRMKNLRLAGI